MKGLGKRYPQSSNSKTTGVPSNLQMDKVAPATLLLEKRRQKYEV